MLVIEISLVAVLVVLIRTMASLNHDCALDLMAIFRACTMRSNILIAATRMPPLSRTDDSCNRALYIVTILTALAMITNM